MPEMSDLIHISVWSYMRTRANRL